MLKAHPRPHSFFSPVHSSAVVASSSSLTLFVQLPACPSSMVHLASHSDALLPSEFSCICRRQMSDEEALRCAVAESSGLGFAQAGRFVANCLETTSVS